MLLLGEWFTDPSTQWLVGQFRRPLVLIDANGSVEFANDAFTIRFLPACLADPALQVVINVADGQRHAVRLVGRTGAALDVIATAMAVDHGTIVVLDPVAEGPGPKEVEDLRARVRELEAKVAIDVPTGAWSRAHLDAVVKTELARSARYHLPVSLVMFDVDRMKRINDAHGHAKGDVVLSELVRLMSGGIRAADQLFRLGGDEFVVLAASSGYRGATTLAESVRAKITGHLFPAVGRVTVSAGVAEHSDGEGTESWFQRVDQALYAAKTGGRNRVHVDRSGATDAWAAAVGGALQLKWTEAYACGHRTIDAEHEALFDLANEVIGAAGEGPAPSDRLQGALEALIEHLRVHFAHEERILAAHNYEHLETHRRIHASLLHRTEALRRLAERGQCRLGDVVEFLANTVIQGHFLTADRLFFPLFKDGTAG